MLRILNVVAILALVGSAVYAYSIKYATLYQAEQMAKLKHECRRDDRSPRCAPNGRTSPPVRIEALADQYLGGQVLQCRRSPRSPACPTRARAATRSATSWRTRPFRIDHTPAPAPSTTPAAKAKPGAADLARTGSASGAKRGIERWEAFPRSFIPNLIRQPRAVSRIRPRARSSRRRRRNCVRPETAPARAGRVRRAGRSISGKYCATSFRPICQEHGRIRLAAVAFRAVSGFRRVSLFGCEAGAGNRPARRRRRRPPPPGRTSSTATARCWRPTSRSCRCSPSRAASSTRTRRPN